MPRVDRTADAIAEYATQRPYYEEFTNKLVELLRDVLKIKGIDVHLLEGRAKQVESFREKISRATKKYTNPIREITDLSGIRIIVYYEDDVEKVCDLIRSEFTVDLENSVVKRGESRPEVFGYQSIHYVIQLNATRGSLMEWARFRDFRCEIQVRTVLQHSWAAISHKLQYKRETEVPTVLRRKLHRLSALMELADEQFLSMRDANLALVATLESKIAAGQLDVEIDRLSVEEFLRTSKTVQQLVEIAKSSGFDEVTNQEPESVSALIADAKQFGINSIEQLNETLSKNRKSARNYLTSVRSDLGGIWTVDSAFLCRLLIFRVFSSRITLAWLVQTGWGQEPASAVLRALKKLHS